MAKETSSTTTVPDFVRLDYPGVTFRPVPGFSLNVPPEWLVTEFPGALFAIGSAAEGGNGWSNVIVRHERVLPNAALEDIARLTWLDLAADFPGLSISDERLIRFEHIHYVREVLLPAPPNGEAVSRIDSFVFGPVVDQPTLDLFHFSWLNPASMGDEIKRTYVQILSSLRFVDQS